MLTDTVLKGSYASTLFTMSDTSIGECTFYVVK